MAQISVAENGDNQIVIIPGANDTLTASDIEDAQELLDSSKVGGISSASLKCNLNLIFLLSQVLVCQLETPTQPTLAALRRFKDGVSILNASPAPSENTLELFTLPTILCVNQVEAASMSKRAVPNIE